MPETYFNANYTKNPVNLIHRCHSHPCNPQQRYKLTPKQYKAIPVFKYLAYKQCLPGSVALKTNTFDVEINVIGDNVKFVTLTNDILCKAYDGPQQCSNPTTQNITPKHERPQESSEDGNPRDKGKNAYYARAY